MSASGTISPKLAEGKTQSHTVRNGLLCALVFTACLWTAWPVAEMGFIDDWSYARTAQIFAQTGHFVYNGWAAPIGGWQIIWGALFIKLFGFSFTVVRLSALPVAMATIALFYANLVRFGITSRNAVLGTLTLAFSSVFMPLASSYMTDIPGLFVILLCLYCCRRAVDAGNSKETIFWLCLATASNLIGGTARQTSWFGALVMVPSAGWLLRKRRGVLPTVTLLWTISVAAVFACMQWFSRQPYTVPESLFGNFDYKAANYQTVCFELLGTLLMLSLLVYPVLAAWLPQARQLSRAALLRIALLNVLLGLAQWRRHWGLPWIGHIIEIGFSAPGIARYGLAHVLLLPMWLRYAGSLLVFATTLIFVESLWQRLGPLVKNRQFQLFAWRDILWLLGPFTGIYLALLMPRLYHVAIFDRYLLPLGCVAIIGLLKLHQQWISETLPAIAPAVLAVIAVIAVCGTHDWFACYRARVAAIAEIRASGVPRTEIQGGFEYDGQTQIETAGYMNEPRMVLPPGAFHPDFRFSNLSRPCQYSGAPTTPAIHPLFTIAFGKEDCLDPTDYPPVTYRTWLPPYDRTVYIQAVPPGLR